MQEIKCPNCGEVFVVDESGYAQIVQQVRDKEFDKVLLSKEAEIAEKEKAIEQLKAVDKFRRTYNNLDLSRMLKNDEVCVVCYGIKDTNLKYLTCKHLGFMLVNEP